MGPHKRPGGAAAKNAVNTFPGAVGAAAHCAAIKNFLKFFIRKQYYDTDLLSPPGANLPVGSKLKLLPEHVVIIAIIDIHGTPVGADNILPPARPWVGER